MIKTLFLIKSLKTPSSRIRVADLQEKLTGHGIMPSVIPLPLNVIDKWSLFCKAREYDVVVLQKRLLNIVDFHILRKSSKCLVFDFDDAIYLKNASPSQNPSDYRSKSREDKFRRTVKNSDMIIAANRTLAGKAASEVPGKPVRIIASPVNTDEIPVKKSWTLGKPIVIGWVGSSSTLRYIEHIRDVFPMLGKKYDFILKIVADKAPDIPGVNVQFVPWKLETQYENIVSFDIGLMPLSRDPFSEGKAAYKLLQYMAAGVPSVSSPVGMNSEFTAGEEYCLEAESIQDFADKISMLIENQSLRENYGLKGRKLMENHFSISVTAGKLADAIHDAHSFSGKK